MNNELYHHGILGQKWGVRRYQNADGSLTPAGKKRYTKLYNEMITKGTDDEMLSMIASRLQMDVRVGDLSDYDVNSGIKYTHNYLTNEQKTKLATLAINNGTRIITLAMNIYSKKLNKK